MPLQVRARIKTGIRLPSCKPTQLLALKLKIDLAQPGSAGSPAAIDTNGLASSTKTQRQTEIKVSSKFAVIVCLPLDSRCEMRLD